VAQSWLSRHFIFIAPEEPTLDSVLVIAKQLVRRKGVRGIVIDPWNDIEHSRPIHMSETEYVSQALSKILRFAKTNGVHVWIVAHPTKLLKDKNGKYPVPTPYDISGSANWRNKSDNCVTVWRDLDPQAHSKDVEIHVQKIRHKIVGHLGMATLEYERHTGRYFEPVTVANYYGQGEK
jgi:twinkle protein